MVGSDLAASIRDRTRITRRRPQFRPFGSLERRDDEVLAALDFDGDLHPTPTVALPRLGLVVRRMIDITIAAVGLVVTALLMLVLAALVKFGSDGPVLFRQERVGKHGARFTVLKFRTMRDGTHDQVRENDAALQAYRDNDFKLPANDPRITLVGRWLRKTSLDELPQLLNVLRGEMSIVGIRPLLAEELALRPDHDQALYAMLRPGLTGLWQVEGRSTLEKTDRFALDRTYVETWSVWNDVKIIARTPFAMLRIGHTH